MINRMSLGKIDTITVFARLAGLFLTLPAAAGAVLYHPEPSPYRGEQQYTGSDFHYNRTSFLDRFSFRPPAESAYQWNQSRRGFVAAVGSTTSDEFLSSMRFFAQQELVEDFSFSYRFIRDEDFDGVYDSNLIGFTKDLPLNWNLALYGDVIRDKEDIDGQLELAHGALGQNYFRLVYSLVDLRFNAKQEDAEYRRQPRTVFAESMQKWGGWDLHVHINRNTPLRLYHYANQEVFDFEQTQWGLRVRGQTASQLLVHFFVDGEWGERSRRERLAGSTDTTRFNRRYAEAALELGMLAGRWRPYRLGLRVFSFEERTFSPQADTLFMHTVRREPLLFVRHEWRLGDNLVFTPALYLTRIDNHEDFLTEPQRDTDHEMLMGKLAFPLQWRFGKNGYLVFNPTMYTHKLNFGGMNILGYIPF